jgi:hypothetical protein
MATPTNLPEHITIGSYVKIAEWVGRVEDIAFGTSHVLVLVSSPKQVYRHSRPEWLEFHQDNPGMIRQASMEDFARECTRYASMAETVMDDILEMGGGVK